MSRTKKILASLIVLGLVATLGGWATFSAFSSTTSNTNNSFAAGTVNIGDNDAGAAMYNVAGMKPGDSVTSCIKVTYTGSLNARVRLYASVTGTLKNYLTLTVTRGTDSTPTFDNCTTFVPDATDYNGNGLGVVYSGLLSNFPADWAAGIVDPKAASPETWTTGEAHVYKFVISMNNDTAAQGLSSTAAFSWEARNL